MDVATRLMVNEDWHLIWSALHPLYYNDSAVAGTEPFMVAISHERLEFTSYPIQLDLHCTTIEANFGSAGPQRSLPHPYWDEPSQPSEVICQSDVYFHAKQLVNECHILRVVDVGCGDAQKLASYFGVGDVKTENHGVDLPNVIDAVRTEIVDLHGCNLALYNSIHECFEQFHDSLPTLFILADVIEHLLDPRPIFRKLRQLLKRNPSNRLVLSTPSRFRINENNDRFALNKTLVREWELEELVSFVASCGFSVDKQAFIRCDNVDSVRKTCYLECSCPESFYESFLQRNGLPPSTSLLIITAEHSDLGPTGGIGSYVATLEVLLRDLAPIVLFFGQMDGFSLSALDQKRWLYPERLLGETGHADNGDLLLETVLQSVFFYDDLTLLQTHDYLGYSYRVVQAKKAGLMPPEVIVKVTCHGSQCCLEAAHEYWTPVSNLHILHREKEAIEKADVLTFPTQYLRNLYVDRGYDLSGPQIEMHPHPWTGDSDEVREHYLPIDTLIFFGRRQTLKGYYDFLTTLLDIAREKEKTARYDRLSRVIFLGELVAERPEDHDLLDELRQTLDITEYALPRVAALELLKEERHRSLVVLPYRGDNHPWCVLECIYLWCQFVAYEAGGIPEMIPPEHRQWVLCKPSSANLTVAIDQLLGLSGEQRRELVTKLRDSVSAMRTEANDLLKKRYESGYREIVKMRRPVKLNSDLVSIIVTAYNTPMRYISDLCRGINDQTLQPKEVIFVDDGSEHGFVSQLESELRQSLKTPYRVISQHNGGVAAARNTGWLKATTKYVVAHDDDNILKPDFLWVAVDYLESNPTVAAVTSYFEQFEDGKDMEVYDSDRYIYKPLFNSLIMSLNANHLGDAMGCYRRDILQAVGGWDDADRSMWEDWALYLRLISCGHRIGLINSCQFLYRWRVGSMLRNGNKYAAECRLARSIYTLPRFDAFDLKRLAADNLRKQNELASLENELASLENELASLENELASLKYTVARSLTEQLNRFPSVKRLLKHTLLRSWKICRRMKGTPI